MAGRRSTTSGTSWTTWDAHVSACPAGGPIGWAANDKEALKDVSPDGAVTVIRLDLLSEQNVKDILAKNHGVEDTDGFIKAGAETRGRETVKKPAEHRHAGQVRLTRKMAGFPQGDVRPSLSDGSPVNRTKSTGRRTR